MEPKKLVSVKDFGAISDEELAEKAAKAAKERAERRRVKPEPLSRNDSTVPESRRNR